MNSTISNIKDKLKRLPHILVNGTKNEIQDLLHAPLDILSSGLENLLNQLKSFGLVFAALGSCMALIIIMPLIELTFIGMKIAKIPADLWLNSARRVSIKLKELISPEKRRRRLDDAVKRRL